MTEKNKSSSANKNVSSFIGMISTLLPILGAVLYGLYYVISFDIDIKHLKKDVSELSELSEKVDDIDDRLGTLYQMCEQSKIIKRIGNDNGITGRMF